MSTDTLLAIAERCEQSDCPCDELDIAMHSELASFGWNSTGNLLNFSASIDAAMTLVPAGHTVQLCDWDHALLRSKGAWQAIILPIGARGAMQSYTFSNRCDHASTLPLAICTAALRAHASRNAS